MVNKSDNATGSAKPATGKDPEPAQTREERLAAELRRNLLKRKAQSRGRAEETPGQDRKDDGSGA